jgi:hypothetical protein
LRLEPLEDRSLPSTFGAMGDSYTDETGPTLGIPNWVELLVAGERADFGPLGSFPAGDPRAGSGLSYEYNFALGGARASSFAGCGTNQQTGCATGGSPRFRAYATAGRLDYGVLEIGGNDFIQDGILGGRFLVLPYGLWRPGNELFSTIKSNYLHGLDLATDNARAPVHMLLANLPDLGTFPLFGSLPPAQRDVLRTWIIAWNNEVLLQATRRGYAVWDLWSAWEEFRSSGGATIHGLLVSPGVWDGSGGPQGMSAFFIDGLHPTPIAHALLANRLLANLNAHYGTAFPLLTPKEMVTLSLLDPEQPPIAVAGGPYTIEAGQDLRLSSAGSTDPNPGDIPYLQYSWDLDGDGNFDDAFGANPTVSWDQLEALGIVPGQSYEVRLLVNDTFGGLTTSEPTVLTVGDGTPPPGPGNPTPPTVGPVPSKETVDLWGQIPRHSVSVLGWFPASKETVNLWGQIPDPARSPWPVVITPAPRAEPTVHAPDSHLRRAATVVDNPFYSRQVFEGDPEIL